jgi:nucleoid-associated protein YgaU
VEVDAMTSRRKSIGRGDEASGPVMSAEASRSMARGESLEDLAHHRYGKPKLGAYSRRIGGDYGASVQDLQ